MGKVKSAWERWKKIAEFVGSIQIAIVFSILYFLIFVPVGVVTSLFNDFLKLKAEPAWTKMEKNSRNIKEMQSE